MEFDDFRLDVGAAELMLAGKPVSLEPQVFDLIVFLARRPGKVVSRDDIIESVWGGRVVSDSAISTRINAARKALGDDGSAQKLIKTIHGRGFRFEPVPKTVAPAVFTQPEQGPALSLPNKPSIAVLHFENMSEDPEQEYFSDGITEDVITELSRYKELMVIARNSTSPYKGRVPDIRQIAMQLGVGHVLAGSVRRSANRVRIAARLIDAQTGSHVWADRYERDLEDIFAVQEEISAIIVNTLSGKLAHQVYQRSLHRRPESLDAYDHALRASVLLADWDRRETALARAEAERAISLEPDFARAHALLAWAHSLEGVLRWAAEPQASFRKGFQSAIRAVELDHDEPWAHAALGFSELWGRHEHENGIASLQRALELNPNNAHLRVWFSNALCLAGRSEDGLVEIEAAMRLNPVYPPIYLHFYARVLATLKQYDQAIPHLERLVKLAPTSTNSLALYAACNAAVGRSREARSAIARLLKLSPDFRLAIVPDASPYAREEDLDSYMDLLRQAGLPE